MTTQYPALQKDRLLAVLTHIEQHPETWDQSTWHCGTTHCFGGWAQLHAGHAANSNTVRRDARQWLGLTRYEADKLFAGSNTLSDLRAIVADLVSDGYDRNGYDRDGYNRNGYDCDGYNRNGYDRNGYDRNGYDCDGYDCDDCDDCDGYDYDGLNTSNQTRQ